MSREPWLSLQKMDRDGDGVVTLDEFLDTCQQVTGRGGRWHRHPPRPPFIALPQNAPPGDGGAGSDPAGRRGRSGAGGDPPPPRQDGDIMSSLRIFENVI